MNKDEKLICEFLTSYRLEAKIFSKAETRKGKTPDFRVFHGEIFQFFCEVKSIDQDLWLDKQLDAAPPGIVVGGLRNDPVYNRLTSDVHEAVKQFDAVNKDITHPNVLALVSHDKKCKINELINVLTGTELTNNGSALPIFQYYSEGRIQDEKKRIHLFLWIDNWVDSIDSKGFLFCDTNENHYQTLCSLFGKDPNSIKQIGSYRDREEPHSSLLPHHVAYGSVLRGSADQAESDPREHKAE